MYYIGVDLGGTNIAAGLVDEKGNILNKYETPTLANRHYSEILKDMADLILRLIKNSNLKIEDIAAIGIGSPGVADNNEGKIIFANNLNWRHVPVKQELQKHINLPVLIDNDATVAGLAEAVCGACRGYDNSVTITLGTGVGGGIIINGKPFSGSHGVGSEIGHLIVHVGGINCTCGNFGCLERYASATALIEEGKKAAEKNPASLIAKKAEGDLNKITAKVVIDSAKEGDKDALEIFDNYIYYLAMGIISIINFIDPAIIAIGGGVSKAGEFLLNAVRKKVEEHIFYKDLPHCEIRLAQLGNDAGIIGAAMLGKVLT